jgi:fatty-acyl-CoA synthase
VVSSAVSASDWIAHHARYRPTAEAAHDLNSGRRFSYAQFDERVTRAALWLKKEHDIGRGDRVAILSPNDTDVFELQFACRRLGAIFLPLNWRLEVSDFRVICENAAPKITLHGLEFSQQALELDLPRASLANGGRSDYESGLARASGAISSPPLDLDDVWILMYTSGTSGQSKGVQITYRMCVFNALHCAILVGLTSRSRNLVVLPTYFTGGLNIYGNPTFHCGGANIVMRTFDPSLFLALLADKSFGLTHLMGTPANFAAMTQEPGFTAADFSHLQAVGIGGSPAPRALIQSYGERGIRLRQGWGMTETGPLGLLLSSEMALEKIGSCGLPPLYVELKICGADGKVVRQGETGELLIKGPNVMPGYWKLEEVNRRSFTPDGWFKTGDAARQDADGYYYIVDRWEDIFECDGKSVFPAEVESVIQLLSEVMECAVVGVPSPVNNHVGRAFVAMKQGHHLGADAILDHCRRHLAPYALPREVHFLGALPRNGAGKVIKRQLPRN